MYFSFNVNIIENLLAFLKKKNQSGEWHANYYNKPLCALLVYFLTAQIILCSIFVVYYIRWFHIMARASMTMIRQDYTQYITGCGTTTPTWSASGTPAICSPPPWWSRFSAYYCMSRSGDLGEKMENKDAGAKNEKS